MYAQLRIIIIYIIFPFNIIYIIFPFNGVQLGAASWMQVLLCNLNVVKGRQRAPLGVYGKCTGSFYEKENSDIKTLGEGNGKPPRVSLP